ncbi:hypothetical protein [Bradyrhizobium japonicum]|uniref:hypothetical protein n=1 Tax=Bradyrhizobium japonicum TaxID=375 RepID=UPI000409CFF9|nr:hypothetical protein [Bradyrhizobium japonicum]
MASVTVEDLANMALGILVEAPIDSLDDNTKAARLLNLHYETTRQSELMKNAWSFAIFRVELDPEADAPTGDVYGYGYSVPDDALRVLPLTDTGEAEGARIPFKHEGGLLLTNYSGPRLVRYIANLTDPADWDPLFVEALAARLAMKIAMPLTNKPSVLQGAQVVYNEAISEARRINSIVASSAATVPSWAQQRGDWSDVR